MYLPILHLLRAELRCKLQEKLHRVTGPYYMHIFTCIFCLNIGIFCLKCYFKRKYLNLIDPNCDVQSFSGILVDESCLWLFIGTVFATGPECIINIYYLLKIIQKF